MPALFCLNELEIMTGLALRPERGLVHLCSGRITRATCDGALPVARRGGPTHVMLYRVPRHGCAQGVRHDRVLPADAAAPTRVERLSHELGNLKRFLGRLAATSEIRACYEASGAGYVLQRAMREWGFACVVIAPSLIPTKPGSQRKHDKT